MTDHTGFISQTPRHAQEAVQFKAVLWLTFPAFLLVALGGRMLPRREHASLRGLGQRPTLFKEARITAAAMIPFAFMG